VSLVVSQHIGEAATVATQRHMLIDAPHINLQLLRRADDRLAAHFDGLCVAGVNAWSHCEALFEAAPADAGFVWMVQALESGEQSRVDRMFLEGTSLLARAAAVTAFGWVESRSLRGVVASFLSGDAIKRSAALAACGMHRVDPGFAKAPWLRDADPSVRARALRTAGEIGYRDGMTACVAALADEDPHVRFWAAWSGVLLGDRNRALSLLVTDATTASPHRARAFRLALQALPTTDAHAVLKGLSRDPKDLRWVVQGSGLVGDPTYIPWLINHMANPALARLAGEAFTLITGVDLDAQQMWSAQPEDFESGPSEDPNDDNVDMDPDEGLPWPDVTKVEQWWAANTGRFQKGQRYFLGQPVTRARCIDVLKHGYQRQRILAAHYLCLLEPGTPLFNTSAPAWRQQRLLQTLA
jgi:uncharacterized protein (TIGR02270 family)